MWQWILSVVTLGVNLVVHHWTINRELSRFGVEVDPTRAALAVFPGGLVVVPYLVTVHRTATRVAVAQETLGLTPTIRPLLAVAASLATLQVPYLQSQLNRVWRADAAQRVGRSGRPDPQSNDHEPRRDPS